MAETGRPGAASASDGEPPHTVSLGTIFWIFFQIGSLSMGGGLSAWLYREIVEKRNLMTSADFMGAMTLAQVMPGINMANLSVYVGQRLRGVQGSLVAMLGLTLVPFFAIILLGTVYVHVRDVAGLHHVLDGMAAAAVGLLLSMGVKAVQVTRMPAVHLAIMGAVVLLVGVLRLPMIPVILVVAPVSIALAWPREETGDSGRGGEGRDA